MDTYTTCAKIEDGIVTNVIVCDTVSWAISRLGGTWVPVYEQQSCGMGYTWDGENFIAPISPEPEIQGEEEL